MKLFFTTIFVAISSYHSVLAQAPDANSSQDAAQNAPIIEAQVNAFIGAINEVSKSGTTNGLMRLFSPRFRNHVTIFDLDGKTKTEDRSYGNTQLFYNRYTQTNVKADYRLTRILTAYANDSVGFAVFEVDYNMYNNGAIYKVGAQNITFQWAKTNGVWLIEDGMSFVRYKQLYKGSCDCALYSKGADFMATLQVPKGEDYTTQYHNIHFGTAKNGQREVAMDGATYLWTIEGKSAITTPDKRILTAKTKNEAEIINLIISDLHKEHCFNVTFKQ